MLQWVTALQCPPLLLAAAPGLSAIGQAGRQLVPQLCLGKVAAGNRCCLDTACCRPASQPKGYTGHTICWQDTIHVVSTYRDTLEMVRVVQLNVLEPPQIFYFH